MAVENQPPLAQSVNPRPATPRAVIQVATAAIALVAVIFAGMGLVVSMTLAPMRDDMRLMRDDMRLMREGLADLRERLTRVETLLERGTDQPADVETSQVSPLLAPPLTGGQLE